MPAIGAPDCETKPIPGLQLIREAIGRGLGAVSNRRSFDFFDEKVRLPEQRLHLAPLLNGLARIESVLQRVFIASWRARSGRTTMHPTSPFPADRRRHARLARTGFSAAAQARTHRAGIARMISFHFFVCAAPLPAHASAS